MKRIIITGATSGLGRGIAERLAGKGWLVGAAGRNEKALEELKELFPENIVTARIDVTDDKAPGQLLALIEKMDGIDSYLHAAGIGFENEALNIAKDTDTLKTNVIGFTRMVDTAFRYFRETGRRGQIAAITSVAGTNGIGRLASYSASKRFQQTYLRALNQLATIQGVNVKFTDLRPGWVRTPLLNPDKVYPMTMSMEEAVPKLTKAMLSKKRVAVVDRRWAILVALWRMIPNALWVKLPMAVSSKKV